MRAGDGGPAGERAGVNDPGRPAQYEIRVDGVLDDRWAAWFGGLQVRSESTQTVISGLLADQPALHGVLAKVRDLGLCLISVRRLGHDATP
jgi:hypothetical protein